MAEWAATFGARFEEEGMMNANFSDDDTLNADFGPVQKVATTDYNELFHKPKINGVELVGDKTTEDLHIEGDKFFAFSQMTPAATWNIAHPLKKFPSVTVVDSGGSFVVGEISYIDNDNVTVTFQSAFAGKAYLN